MAGGGRRLGEEFVDGELRDVIEPEIKVLVVGFAFQEGAARAILLPVVLHVDFDPRIARPL